MYWCVNCQDFTEGELIKGEWFHAEVDTRRYEPYEFMRCDFCGSRDLIEADKCECGEWKLADEYACRDCRKAFREHKLAFLKKEMLTLRLSPGTINDLDESEDVACY